MLHSRFLLIYFVYSRVYLLIPNFQFIPLPYFSFDTHEFVFCLWVGVIFFHWTFYLESLINSCAVVRNSAGRSHTPLARFPHWYSLVALETCAPGCWCWFSQDTQHFHRTRLPPDALDSQAQPSRTAWVYPRLVNQPQFAQFGHLVVSRFGLLLIKLL